MQEVSQKSFRKRAVDMFEGVSENTKLLQLIAQFGRKKLGMLLGKN